MKLPVLIAAHNEAMVIGNLLKTLPRDLVEPVVVANGCTDATVDIAEQFGATVLELEHPGKLPAIQHGLGYLASQGQVLRAPVLLTDADCRPISGRNWAERMASELRLKGGDSGHITGGAIVYNPAHGLKNAVRTIRNIQQISADSRTGSSESWPGGNMGVSIHSHDMLEAILAMPHYWPGEDRALHDTMTVSGATDSKIPQLRAAVLADSRYMLPLLPRVLMPVEERVRTSRENYAKRAAPGSFPYGTQAEKISEDLAR